MNIHLRNFSFLFNKALFPLFKNPLFKGVWSVFDLNFRGL